MGARHVRPRRANLRALLDDDAKGCIALELGHGVVYGAGQRTRRDVRHTGDSRETLPQRKGLVPGRIQLQLHAARLDLHLQGIGPIRDAGSVADLAAILAGLGGALYVPQIGIINPSEFSPANSIEIAIWVAVGGRGTLVGAILGAGIVNWFKTCLTGAAPEIWLFFLGALFILVTLAMPAGVVGIARQLRERMKKRRPVAVAAE